MFTSAFRSSFFRFNRLLAVVALAAIAVLSPFGQTAEAQAKAASTTQPNPDHVSGFVCSVSYSPATTFLGKFGYVRFTVHTEPNCQGAAIIENDFFVISAEAPAGHKGTQYGSRAEIMMMFEQLLRSWVDAVRVQFRWGSGSNDRSVSNITFRARRTSARHPYLGELQIVRGVVAWPPSAKSPPAPPPGVSPHCT